ncbi:hypothetical protein JTE90_012747 [Oedothorax gibbosus]|uniref:C2H2-type domain-containing protein n=1 Tax=Oedothorax gibbosus TaxID=931172 RepID=A0AAV6VYH2_9ARAC|nr:hypothetical protein JTE90_012747 [Oedothorax gibbosus]
MNLIHNMPWTLTMCLQDPRKISLAYKMCNQQFRRKCALESHNKMHADEMCEGLLTLEHSESDESSDSEKKNLLIVLGKCGNQAYLKADKLCPPEVNLNDPMQIVRTFI